MTSKFIYLGIGTNLGNRLQNIQNSIKELSNYFSIIKVSSVYETSPIGPKQETFLNIVLSGTSKLSPLELLKAVKNSEIQIGRKPSFKWGPRIIDIDILIHDDVVFSSSDLTLPHPEIKNRRFVLEPLLEIAGNLPINNHTLLYYLNENLGQNCEKTFYNIHNHTLIP